MRPSRGPTISMHEPFADIHCHILPGIDDGAKNWDDTLAMARLAADDGTATIVATPHQLGSWSQNRGDEIRPLVDECNERLAAEKIPLTVLAGGEIRIEPGLIDQLVTGELVTLGDHRRHVLLGIAARTVFPDRRPDGRAGGPADYRGARPSGAERRPACGSRIWRSTWSTPAA